MTAFEAPATAARSRASLARVKMIRSALIFILTPTILYALYLILLAPAQYLSTSSFAVRGAQAASGDALSALGFVAPTSNVADAKIVENYIRSEAMVVALKERYGFDKAYSRFSLDPTSRVSADASLRKATQFWRGKVKIVHDPATAGARIDVSAFTAEDAVRLNRGVLQLSEELVNTLPSRALNDLIAAADREVISKRALYDQARDRLTEYSGRQFSGLQASAPAEQAMRLVGSLDSDLARKRAELAMATQTFQPGAPQLLGLQREVAALEAERARAVESALRAPGERAAGGEIEAQSLMLDYQTAQRGYESAVQAAQGARRQQVIDRKYVVSYIPANQPQSSDWWSRLKNILAVFLGASLLWAAGALTYSIIRDHIE